MDKILQDIEDQLDIHARSRARVAQGVKLLLKDLSRTLQPASSVAKEHGVQNRIGDKPMDIVVEELDRSNIQVTLQQPTVIAKDHRIQSRIADKSMGSVLEELDMSKLQRDLIQVTPQQHTTHRLQNSIVEEQMDSEDDEFVSNMPNINVVRSSITDSPIHREESTTIKLNLKPSLDRLKRRRELISQKFVTMAKEGPPADIKPTEKPVPVIMNVIKPTVTKKTTTQLKYSKVGLSTEEQDDMRAMYDFETDFHMPPPTIDKKMQSVPIMSNTFDGMLLDPTHLMMIIWTHLYALSLIVISFVQSTGIAFTNAQSLLGPSSIILIVLVFIDTCLRLNSCLVLNGELIINRRKVFETLWKNGYLVANLVGAFPYILVTGPYSANQDMRLAKLLYLVTLLNQIPILMFLIDQTRPAMYINKQRKRFIKRFNVNFAMVFLIYVIVILIVYWY